MREKCIHLPTKMFENHILPNLEIGRQNTLTKSAKPIPISVHDGPNRWYLMSLKLDRLVCYLREARQLFKDIKLNQDQKIRLRFFLSEKIRLCWEYGKLYFYSEKRLTTLFGVVFGNFHFCFVFSEIKQERSLEIPHDYCANTPSTDKVSQTPFYTLYPNQ